MDSTNVELMFIPLEIKKSSRSGTFLMSVDQYDGTPFDKLSVDFQPDMRVAETLNFFFYS